MKIRSICTRGTILLTLAASAAALSACGDSETAGSPTGFQVVPESITFTGPDANTCGGGTTRVFVYGGAGPYRIDNTAPVSVTVSTTSVSGPGGYFDVQVAASTGCLTSIPIVVVDQLNKQVTFTVTTEKGS
jgi:hypothetical protein